MSLSPSSSAARPDDYGVSDGKLELLRTFDTVFLVDDSYSMEADVRHENTDTPKAQTRWNFACELTAEFAAIAARYDADGVDVHFLNQTGYDRLGLKTREEITNRFGTLKPTGSTPLGARLRTLMWPYLEQLRRCNKNWPKPRNYIILTDGQPDKDIPILNKHLRDVFDLLVALKCPKTQIGLQFVQVGDDEYATRFLQRLDNNDFGEHDFIDTVKHDPRQSKAPKAGWMAKLSLSSKLGSGKAENKLLDQHSPTIKALLGGISRYHDNQK